jgi:hypothetical protein
MNARERFDAVMHYRPVDRCPMMDFGFWDETIEAWEEQGLPKGTNTDDWFGMDAQWSGCGANVDLCPWFPEEILEERENTVIVRQGDGTVVERGKGRTRSIPRHISHLLQDRETWEKHFKHRLRPDDPARFPAPEEWEKRVAKWTDPNRDYPLSIHCGSLYGRPREWFSVERISEVLYDDYALFE